MIDLTPLDVRKKRGDFRKVLRGYEPEEVDTFLELVAERMEWLVKENLTLSERSSRLQEQVSSLEGRERAVHDALVTAQELRAEVREQARREAEILKREAEADARGLVEEAERVLALRRREVTELRRERIRFLRSFRALLERQMGRLEDEEARFAEGEADVTPGGSAGESRAAKTVVSDPDEAPGEDPGLLFTFDSPEGEPSPDPWTARAPWVPPSRRPPAGTDRSPDGDGEPGTSHPRDVAEEDSPPEVRPSGEGEELSTWLSDFLEDREGKGGGEGR